MTHSTPEGKGEQPMPFIGKVGFTALMIFLVLFISWFIDWAAFNDRYFNAVVYSKECDFIVPDGYKIVYSESRGTYAVNKGDTYLWHGRYGLSFTWPKITSPSQFLDSCTAKGALHEYLIGEQPKSTDFK